MSKPLLAMSQTQLVEDPSQDQDKVVTSMVRDFILILAIGSTCAAIFGIAARIFIL